MCIHHKTDARDTDGQYNSSLPFPCRELQTCLTQDAGAFSYGAARQRKDDCDVISRRLALFARPS